MLLEDYASVMAPAASGIPGVEILIGTGCRVVGKETHGDLEITTIETNGEIVRVSLEVPLGDVEGYWYPNATLRALPADWSGRDKTSIISSSPLGCLYDRHGRNILAFCFDQQIEESQLRFGVSEEHKSFVVYYEHDPKGPRTIRMATVRPGLEHVAAIGLMRDWLRDDIGEPLAVPFDGTVPVYCTWYAYSQDISAAKIERDAALARALGCRAVIIDDGWQRLGQGRWYAGCGDWVADAVKFPDMRAHVTRLHELGLSVILWVAPLLLGENSDIYARLKQFAPYYNGDGWRASALDPRYREVRDHFVETCIRLVRDYDVDGLKLDFLDGVVAYQGTPTAGDIPDVGQAIHATLAQLREGLKQAGLEEVLIEFRQSYIGPATAPYGNLLRVGDCPVDANQNRRATVNMRMIAAGQVIHSDPTVWDHRAGAEPAARQLLNAYFSVPQISMDLSSLPHVQRDAVRTVLSSWMEDRETVLFGQLQAGLPSEGYPVLQARHEDRLVVGVYQPLVVDIDLDGIDELRLLNATSHDRIVVRWTGRRSRLRGVAHSARGDAGTEIEVVATQGLTELQVPVSGIATLHVLNE